MLRYHRGKWPEDQASAKFCRLNGPVGMSEARSGAPALLWRMLAVAIQAKGMSQRIAAVAVRVTLILTFFMNLCWLALDYIVFFPHALRQLRPFEPRLAWNPLGAQTMTIAITARSRPTTRMTAAVIDFENPDSSMTLPNTAPIIFAISSVFFFRWL